VDLAFAVDFGVLKWLPILHLWTRLPDTYDSHIKWRVSGRRPSSLFASPWHFADEVEILLLDPCVYAMHLPSKTP